MASQRQCCDGGVDPTTAAELGGWDSVALFIETYAHAMPKARITDGLFSGQDSDTPKRKSNKNKEI
jgi:hypothetical protein